MAFKYAYIFPILAGIWFPLTFLITYLMAVQNKDVPLVFPYISDTGTWSPESCFFAVMLNFGALIMGAIVYIRYRQVQYLCKNAFCDDTISNLNSNGLVIGVIAAVGVSFIGDFQETNALYIHILSAMISFGLGTVYQVIQTYISIKIYPNFGNKVMNRIRIVFSFISAITFVVTTVLSGVAFFQFKGDDMTKWKPDDGGYTYHSISAINEWVLAFATVLFLSLFTEEFRKIQFIEPEITVDSSNDNYA